MSLLEIKNIAITVNNKFICRDLSLNLQPGERIGVLGPNGSGKTTLLHALANLRSITSGNIFLNNINIVNLPRKAISKNIGILFQDVFTHFPQTINEYCRAARFPHLAYFQSLTAADEHIIIHALQVMELDHLSSRQIIELSGGEKRRVAIAALLSQNPFIYLLDEPTNQLDVRFQIRALKHFHALCEKKTASLIMTLHDPTLAQIFCDYVLLLFPNGKTLYGRTNVTLTKENLSQLYQHPIDSFTFEKSIFWYPSMF